MSWPYMPHQCRVAGTSCLSILPRMTTGVELPGACAHPRIGMELFVARGDLARRLGDCDLFVRRPGAGRIGETMAAANIEANREAASRHRRRFPGTSCSARGLGPLHEEAFLDPPGCPVCECASTPRSSSSAGSRSGRSPIGTRCASAWIGRLLPAPRAARAAGATAPPIPGIVRGALEQLGSAPAERGECPACASVRQAREQSEGMLHTVWGHPT